MTISRLSLSLILLLSPACGGDDAICSADALESALLEAPTTVQIGECSIEGSFTVPAGVDISGTGPASVISSDGVALTLSGGAVRDLMIDSSGRAAIVARDGTGITIERVRIRVTLGIGIGIESVSQVELTDVELSGPVSASNATQFPPTVTSTESATHGLVLVGVDDATLSNVAIRGFAEFGALFVGSTSTGPTGRSPKTSAPAFWSKRARRA